MDSHTVIMSLTCIFRDHLHIFVGQSSPSFSSRPTVCCQPLMSAVSTYFFISSQVLSIHLRLGRSLLLFFPRYNHVHHFLERLSSSLLLMCPCQFNFVCLRNVDIWHNLASSCMTAALLLHLIHLTYLQHKKGKWAT